jgi:hypothetical protein
MGASQPQEVGGTHGPSQDVGLRQTGRAGSSAPFAFSARYNEGSSGISGKCSADLQEDIGVVAIPIGHAPENLVLVLVALEELRGEGVVA